MGQNNNGGACAVFCVLLLLPFLSFVSSPLCAEEEFSFELEEIEKKEFTSGGFLELRGEHLDVNRGSVFSRLTLEDPELSNIDRILGSIQLDGSYGRGMVSLNWQLTAAAQQDTLGWSDLADVNSAYLSIQPNSSLTLSLGKKTYMWGKGYAWNPAGFLNRYKDPNNPENALEGYVALEGDFIKSFQGSLQTAALTLAALPVWEGINEDFGERDNVNLAAKLYLLYLDTDIDLILLAGNSRPHRMGLDFSTNVAPHFEVHGEAAYIPDLQKVTLRMDGSSSLEQRSAFSTLIGLRYLFENDITSIVEYYYNGGGYSESEMAGFYQLAEAGAAEQPALGASLLDRARELSLKGYGRPQSGRQYLYTRFTGKEPFDILYFTPGITCMLNLEDQSYSITPEAVYTGLTNWEFRLRFSLLNGGSYTEYGEKLNGNKLELRMRYFF